jgi:tetratricopeptide (TPR) repeat protein
VDAVDGKHLWSERYDRKLDDLFEIQDDITLRIWEAMETKLTVGEQARKWAKRMQGGLEQNMLLFQGRARFIEFTPEAHVEAERLWGEALEKRPESGVANLAQGFLHYQKLVMGWTDSPRSSIASARYYANKAHTIMGDGSSLSLLGFVDMVAGNCESAIEHAERAVEVDPSAGDAISMAGTTLIVCGKTKEGVDLVRRGMRLQPQYPVFVPLSLSLGLLVLGEHEEAEEVLEAIIRSNPENRGDRLTALGNLVVVRHFKGEREKAAEDVSQILIIDSAITTTSYRRRNLLRFFKDQEFPERYIGALRQAGLPE